ncbi:hypothetical protein [Paenibacillus humicus]|nr:hypothetical protein [Paenibacillus humicus]
MIAALREEILLADGHGKTYGFAARRAAKIKESAGFERTLLFFCSIQAAAGAAAEGAGAISRSMVGTEDMPAAKALINIKTDCGSQAGSRRGLSHVFAAVVQ